MTNVKVIRVLVYEGEEEAVRTAIQLSLPLGIRNCRKYSITVAEHLNELPKLQVADISNEDIRKAIDAAEAFGVREELEDPFTLARVQTQKPEM